MVEYNRNSNNMNYMDEENYISKHNQFRTTAYIVRHCGKWHRAAMDTRERRGYMMDRNPSPSDYPKPPEYEESPVTVYESANHAPIENYSVGIDDDEIDDTNDTDKEMEIISVLPWPKYENNHLSLPTGSASSIHPHVVSLSDRSHAVYGNENMLSDYEAPKTTPNSRYDCVLERHYFDRWNELRGIKHPSSQLKDNLTNYKTLASIHGGTNSLDSTDSTVAPSDIPNAVANNVYYNASNDKHDKNTIPESSEMYNQRFKPGGRNYRHKSRRSRVRTVSQRASRRGSKAYKSPFKRDFITDNLCAALLTTFFCCLPLGIASLYYTLQVRKSLGRSDLEQARLNSLRSRKLSNTGVMIGITALAACVLVLIVRENVPYSSMEYDYYLPDYNGG